MKIINMRARFQRGASGINTIIVVAVLGYGVFVGLQYVPQMIEWGTVNSMLDSLRSQQVSNPPSSVQEIEADIGRLLDINEMRDMAEHFNVRRQGDGYLVSVNYERELNLLFTHKIIQYHKELPIRD